MEKPALAFLFLVLTQLCQAQSALCPQDPPLNPYLPDSPWPIYHRNNYAQASTCLTGPLPGDSLAIRARTRIQGGTSPWVYLSEAYPNGERVLLYSNATHVFKLYDNGEAIVAVDSLRIDFDPITSFGWNFLQARDKVWFTYDPKYDPEDGQYTRLFKLTDADPTDPFSDIIVLDTFDLGDYGVNRVQAFNLNYRGQIVFNSENDTDNGYATVGVISQDFELLDTLRYATTPDEITHHNTFPIDEHDAFYIVTTRRLLCFAWDGADLSLAWEAPYDFVGDGPTGNFAEGSGTTPTLLGWGEGRDQLVVMADGHAQNNLVAFWRELPPGWTGIPGMDLRFAGAIPLPAAVSFSNLFQSIENSPTAYGYDIGIAQFNGFLGYDCDNLKGVQKITWDTVANEFQLAWVNTDINMNGVLTYSAGANLVYGSGKEGDCNYYYYALDWDTGELVLRERLGPEGTFTDDPYYDAGNNHLIAEDGSIYFAGGGSLVKVEVVERATAAAEPEARSSRGLRLFPNPATDHLTIDAPRGPVERITIFDAAGRMVAEPVRREGRIEISGLPPGSYFLRVETDDQVTTGRFIKY